MEPSSGAARRSRSGCQAADPGRGPPAFQVLQIPNTNFNPSTATFSGGDRAGTDAANNMVNGISTTGDITSGLTVNASAGTLAYSPARVRAAYGFGGRSQDGTGRRIAVVDAYNDPNIFQGLDQFDWQCGRTNPGPTPYNQHGDASPFLTVHSPSGRTSSPPRFGHDRH